MIKSKTRITLQQLAKKAGLSIGTVSMALQNNPVVKKETRELVKKLADKYHYIPGALGRALVTKSTRQIGLSITDITNPFYAEVVLGVGDVVDENNFKLILSNTMYNAKKEKDFLEVSMQGMLDGVIIDPVENNLDFSLYQLLKEYEVPFVLLRRLEGLENVHYVMVDDKKAARLLTRHLIEQGARRIGYAGSLRCGVTDHDRLLGYKEELESNGIQFNNDFIFEQSSFKLEDGVIFGRDILSKDYKLDAIVAFNDLLAIGIIEAAKEKGLKIGKDIKIVGFDNIYYSSLKEIDLTTINMPKYELGKTAINILFEAIRAKKENKDIELKQIILEPSLVIRSSSIG